jgi:hypothetical protein
MSIFNQIYQIQYPALLEPILPVELPPLSAGDDKQQGSRPLPNVTSYPSRNYLAPLLVLTERVDEGASGSLFGVSFHLPMRKEITNISASRQNLFNPERMNLHLFMRLKSTVPFRKLMSLNTMHDWCFP